MEVSCPLNSGGVNLAKKREAVVIVMEGIQ